MPAIFSEVTGHLRTGRGVGWIDLERRSTSQTQLTVCCSTLVSTRATSSALQALAVGTELKKNLQRLRVTKSLRERAGCCTRTISYCPKQGVASFALLINLSNHRLWDWGFQYTAVSLEHCQQPYTQSCQLSIQQVCGDFQAVCIGPSGSRIA